MPSKNDGTARKASAAAKKRRKPSATAHAQSIHDFQSAPIRWLWTGRIPLGKLTIIDGDPGLGKSVISNADIAARVTRGDAMPDESSGLSKPRAVVLVVAEDDIGDTVRPRLEAAGADLDYVFLIAVKRNSKGNIIPLVIPDDLNRLKRTIKDTRAAMVVIDPITAFLSEKVNSHNDASVRKALGPLKELAEDTGAAVVMIRHLNKSGDAKALYRGGGSIAFSGSARSGLMVERIPDDGEWHALAQVKGNLSTRVKTIKYKLVSALDVDALIHFPYDVPVVVWGEETDLTADELFQKKDARKQSPERDEAKKFLVDLLTDNPTPVPDVKKYAEAAGLSWVTVKRASVDLGVDKAPRRSDKGRKEIETWVWSLPNGLKWSG